MKHLMTMLESHNIHPSIGFQTKTGSTKDKILQPRGVHCTGTGLRVGGVQFNVPQTLIHPASYRVSSLQLQREKNREENCSMVGVTVCGVCRAVMTEWLQQMQFESCNLTSWFCPHRLQFRPACLLLKCYNNNGGFVNRFTRQTVYQISDVIKIKVEIKSSK